MIPKKIHYCWFGGAEKPKLAKKCIDSWKKFCPDYEIIEWNESNFDILSAPLYVRQAYELKKWAFITDYVRLWAMTQYGGIYMDTDVEVVRSLDEFLIYDAISGFEDDERIPTGLMGCRKGFPLFVELLCEYDNISFIRPDGKMDLTTNVIRITNMCLKHGFVPNGRTQTFDGFTIFSKDYFCPYNDVTGVLSKTDNTATIHWFNKSWISTPYKMRSVITKPFHRLFGDDCFRWIKRRV